MVTSHFKVSYMYIYSDSSDSLTTSGNHFQYLVDIHGIKEFISSI